MVYYVLESCGPSEEYYMLSDALPEDKELRNKLKLQRLVSIGHLTRKLNYLDAQWLSDGELRFFSY